MKNKGYEVHGIVRRESIEDEEKLNNIKNIKESIFLHEGSLSDHLSIYKIFSKISPDECYHLSASSFVNYSFNDEYSPGIKVKSYRKLIDGMIYQDKFKNKRDRIKTV